MYLLGSDVLYFAGYVQVAFSVSISVSTASVVGRSRTYSYRQYRLGLGKLRLHCGLNWLTVALPVFDFNIICSSYFG